MNDGLLILLEARSFVQTQEKIQYLKHQENLFKDPEELLRLQQQEILLWKAIINIVLKMCTFVYAQRVHKTIEQVDSSQETLSERDEHSKFKINPHLKESY